MTQKIRDRLFQNRKKGISEVVGAMLLLIVVIVAVGTFAYYLSSLQTQNENRQTFQNAVKNDNLKITSISTYPNNILTKWQFIIYNGSTSTPDNDNASSVVFVNPVLGILNQVTLYDVLYLAEHIVISSVAYNLTQTSGGSPAPAFYYQISNGILACLDLTNTTIHFDILFSACNATFPDTTIFPIIFQSAAVQVINMTVLNFNTQPSGLSGAKINGISIPTFQSNGFNYNGSVYLNLPSRAYASITVNATALDLFPNESLLVTLQSVVGNFFTTIYENPTAIITESLYNENYGSANISDIPIFSAQNSAVGNTSSPIDYYLWTITAGNITCILPGSRLSLAYRYYLCPGFPNPQGPFTVTLTVQTSNGLTSSTYLPFPLDTTIPH